ncbi:MAG: phosphate-starvation-inducible PsiE family protein [Methanolinea sp.]|jgi:uncharacterized membrane protein (DUF373 family)|nr:phosphate-starvation-inducible PsiE family protein [Methanolinea sp.]
MFDNLVRFEKGIYYILVVLLAFVILFSVADLVFEIIRGIILDKTYRLDNHEILSIFGFFLLVLIGIELLDTIKAYIRKQEIHVEIIVLLAIIAVARKIILLDPYGEVPLSDFTLWGMGVVVICLAGAYYLLKKAGISLG